MFVNSFQLDNIDAIEKAAYQAGITNKQFISAIISVVGKESNWKLIEEGSYRYTNNDRIRRIFSKLSGKSDQELDALKQNDVNFFAAVYGGILGNNKIGDGYRYRGRGFNQITGKNNYIQASKDTGIDLLFHPELLNNKDIAAKALIGYYVKNYPAAVRSKKYPISNDINSINSLNGAYDLAYNINRGRHILPIIDTTGGYLKGKSYLPQVYEHIKKKTNNWLFPFILIGAGFFFYFKK